jgi:hypothetical protein
MCQCNVCYFGTGNAHVIALSFWVRFWGGYLRVCTVRSDVLLFFTINHVLVPLCYFAS